MTGATAWVVWMAVAVVLIAPLLFGLWGLWRGRGTAAPAESGPRPTLLSSLLYALAFGAVFFVQELFLVLPKALTPGLRPTLFHNNHRWDGEHPLAALFQGTGALAILVLAGLCALWLARRPPATAAGRLLLVWTIFHGCFQSLPQVVVGAVFAGNDVGMAFGYFGLGMATKLALAVLALAAIVAAAVGLLRPLLALAPPPVRASARGRCGFVWWSATLPGLLALPVIVALRVPGSLDQVAIVPVAEYAIGMAWMQAAAWRVRVDASAPAPSASPRAWRWALAALLAQALVFLALLRPGVAFY